MKLDFLLKVLLFFVLYCHQVRLLHFLISSGAHLGIELEHFFDDSRKVSFISTAILVKFGFVALLSEIPRGAVRGLFLLEEIRKEEILHCPYVNLRKSHEWL